MKGKVCTGVVGAGTISEIYLKNMTARFPELYVKAVCARHPEHAKKRAEQFGIGWCTLEAGKHVYTEKTMTADLSQAAELLALAREKNLVLAAAPDTFLGAGTGAC